MFTGIVQSQAEVISKITKNNLCKLVVLVEKRFINHLEIGASIAINGVCLPAVDFGKVSDDKAMISFDVIDETLRITGLGALEEQGMVNLERSLKVGDELGGHIVSGHVHCQASLVDIKETDENCALFFECEARWMKYVFAKGFITINGTSLTVGICENNTFSVHLIPETLNRTNLGALTQGQKVNLEFDQQTMTIVSTVDAYMRRTAK